MEVNFTVLFIISASRMSLLTAIDSEITVAPAELRIGNHAITGDVLVAGALWMLL